MLGSYFLIYNQTTGAINGKTRTEHPHDDSVVHRDPGQGVLAVSREEYAQADQEFWVVRAGQLERKG